MGKSYAGHGSGGVVLSRHGGEAMTAEPLSPLTDVEISE
jgi:hypothetical protein